MTMSLELSGHHLNYKWDHQQVRDCVLCLLLSHTLLASHSSAISGKATQDLSPYVDDCEEIHRANLGAASLIFWLGWSYPAVSSVVWDSAPFSRHCIFFGPYLCNAPFILRGWHKSSQLSFIFMDYKGKFHWLRVIDSFCL